MLIQESIRPSADLRNHYNEIARQCKEGNEVVIITVNGRCDTVSMAYEEYRRMKTKSCNYICSNRSTSGLPEHHPWTLGQSGTTVPCSTQRSCAVCLKQRLHIAAQCGTKL